MQEALKYLLAISISFILVSCESFTPLNIQYQILQIDDRVEITHIQLFQDGEGFSLRGTVMAESNGPVRIFFNIYNVEKRLISSSSIIYKKSFKRSSFFQSFKIDPMQKLKVEVSAIMNETS